MAVPKMVKNGLNSVLDVSAVFERARSLCRFDEGHENVWLCLGGRRLNVA